MTTFQQLQETFEQIQRWKIKDEERMKRSLIKFYAGKGRLSISSSIVEKGLPKVIVTNDDSLTGRNQIHGIEFKHSPLLKKGQVVFMWEKDNSRQLGPVWNEITKQQRELNRLIFQNGSTITLPVKVTFGGAIGFGTNLIQY